MNNKILIDQLIETFQSIDTKYIYGYMYCSNHKGDGDIIKIEKNGLIFNSDEDNRNCEPYLFYRWGWPGPDVNIYYFKDYGITWAFNKEDFGKNFLIINNKKTQPKCLGNKYDPKIFNNSNVLIGDYFITKDNTGNEIKWTVISKDYSRLKVEIGPPTHHIGIITMNKEVQ